MDIDHKLLRQTLDNLERRLLDARGPHCYWHGELSSSALSTATAVFALATIDADRHSRLIHKGLSWLAENQNDDGGWGDTVLSKSNLSTTLLVWSAFSVAQDEAGFASSVEQAQSWLENHLGSFAPGELVAALSAAYGNDRTFSVPILTMCALAGKLGDSDLAWSLVRPLPFELAAVPHRLYRFLKLSVVSYALPALIAIGLLHYHKRRPANPITSLLRQLSVRRVLSLLARIQPDDGGFLEAIPLTSFVAMSLAAAGKRENQVVTKAVRFLQSSAREDGSWPIDTNLATWVTTLSVNALAAGVTWPSPLSQQDRDAIRQWLLGQRHRTEHPYTHARSGGWAWTDLLGGVPDADDTAGALVALKNLGLIDHKVIDAADAGVKWLLGLQNRDGGIPTFCRGWAKLPFDRSCPDLTAHAVAAMASWGQTLGVAFEAKIRKSTERALQYLVRTQTEDGAWLPLWFGNEDAVEQRNPTYGTARVVLGLLKLPPKYFPSMQVPLGKAVRWLLSAQNADGGWGGAKVVTSSIEETALAVDALVSMLVVMSNHSAGWRESNIPCETLWAAVARGANWLIDRTDCGTSLEPTPIGLYFARLWYFEKLYPLIFSLSALKKVSRAAMTNPSPRQT